jgi:hypothetical protein
MGKLITTLEWRPCFVFRATHITKCHHGTWAHIPAWTSIWCLSSSQSSTATDLGWCPYGRHHLARVQSHDVGNKYICLNCLWPFPLMAWHWWSWTRVHPWGHWVGYGLTKMQLWSCGFKFGCGCNSLDSSPLPAPTSYHPIPRSSGCVFCHGVKCPGPPTKPGLDIWGIISHDSQGHIPRCRIWEALIYRQDSQRNVKIEHFRGPK